MKIFLILIWILLGITAFMMDKEHKEINSEVAAEFILYIISAPAIFLIFTFVKFKEYTEKQSNIERGDVENE